MKTNIYTSPDFLEMDSAYWGLGSTKTDLYFGLCSHDPQRSAAIFSFNFLSKKISKIVSLSDLLAPEENYLPQGKIHTRLFEGKDGNLYFGTHFAYPFGLPQKIKFEGGHMLSLNPKTKKIKDLGIPVKNEGIITMILDKKRMIVYGISAPSFTVFSFDIASRDIHKLTQIKSSSICRTLTIDHVGNLYGSFEKDKLFKFSIKNSRVYYLNVPFSSSESNISEWKGKYRGGVNFVGRSIWRSAVWNKKDNKIYGIHAKQSELFDFDPQTNKINKIIFMGPDDNKRNLNNIYPTLSQLFYDNKIFYVFIDGSFDYSRSSNIIGDPLLLSYDVSSHKKVNHGKIRGAHRKVFGVAGSIIGKNGKIYLLGAVEVLKNEKYNSFNILNKQKFNLGLIELNIN